MGMEIGWIFDNDFFSKSSRIRKYRAPSECIEEIIVVFRVKKRVGMCLLASS